MKRKGLLAVGAAILFVIVFFAAIPLFINAEQFRPRIESALSDSLARQVKIGSLSLALFEGGVTAKNVSIAEDPKFGSTPFLTAKQVVIGVEMRPLLMSRIIHVQFFTVDSPEVRLVRADNGRWNFSSMGVATASNKQADTNPLSVDKLRVTNGRIVVASHGSHEKPTVYENVDLKATSVSSNSAFPFTVAMQTPGRGKVKMDGVAGPVGKKDVAETPFDMKVKLDNFDIASSGVLDPRAGIGGVMSYDGSLKSDGKRIVSSGTAITQKLKLAAAGVPSNAPVGLDYSTTYDMAQQRGTITRGLLRIGSSLAKLSGNYDLSNKVPAVAMRLQGEKMPMQDVQTILPALGVILPAGANLQGGTATANLDISGPIDRLVTTGPLNIVQTTLAGFNLGSKLSPIARLAGINTGSETQIQLLSSQLRVAPEGIRAEGLNIVVPALGTLSGSGTIGTNNSLDFKMVAQLDVGKNMLGALSNMAGLGSGAPRVPFSVKGTTKNPVFMPDVMGVSNVVGASSNQTNSPARSVGDILGGFFGKNK